MHGMSVPTTERVSPLRNSLAELSPLVWIMCYLNGVEDWRRDNQEERADLISVGVLTCHAVCGAWHEEPHG